MASDTPAQAPAPAEAEIPATDYQALPKVSSRVEPMVQVAPTCMIWSMFIGLAVLLLIVVMWAIPNLGPIIGKITGA